MPEGRTYEFFDTEPVIEEELDEIDEDELSRIFNDDTELVEEAEVEELSTEEEAFKGILEEEEKRSNKKEVKGYDEVEQKSDIPDTVKVIGNKTYKVPGTDIEIKIEKMTALDELEDVIDEGFSAEGEVALMEKMLTTANEAKQLAPSKETKEDRLKRELEEEKREVEEEWRRLEAAKKKASEAVEVEVIEVEPEPGEPEPQPEPQPEHQTEPQPEPQPQAEPIQEPEIEIDFEPVVKGTSTQQLEPQPQPKPEPKPQPKPQPTPAEHKMPEPVEVPTYEVSAKPRPGKPVEVDIQPVAEDGDSVVLSSKELQAIIDRVKRLEEEVAEFSIVEEINEKPIMDSNDMSLYLFASRVKVTDIHATESELNGAAKIISGKLSRRFRADAVNEELLSIGVGSSDDNDFAVIIRYNDKIIRKDYIINYFKDTILVGIQKYVSRPDARIKVFLINSIDDSEERLFL